MTRFSEEWYARRLAGSPTIAQDIPTLTDAVNPAGKRIVSKAKAPDGGNGNISHGPLLTADASGAAAPAILILPWPPTGNTATRHTTTGAHYLTDGHRRFRSAVASIWRQSARKPIQSPYSVEVVWYPPDRRRRDSDNVQKTLFDALIACGAIADDSMADKRSYSERVVFNAHANGAVWIRITPNA